MKRFITIITYESNKPVDLKEILKDKVKSVEISENQEFPENYLYFFQLVRNW